jgi:uridine kinase
VTRAELLRRVAASVPAGVRVGVDGVDGSGKTVFADELADRLREDGRPVVRISVDDFHHPRAIRYRRGGDSAEGYWLDAFDYARLRADVLDPLGPGGCRRYRPAAHDLAGDRALHPAPEVAAPDAVLILDGVFLHRDELADVWAFSVFLDVPFDVTARRMAVRDGSSPDPEHPSLRRYVEAQQRYLRMCTPRHRASVVVDNAVLDAPRLVG